MSPVKAAQEAALRQLEIRLGKQKEGRGKSTFGLGSDARCDEGERLG
jgi:hypothetical protein